MATGRDVKQLDSRALLGACLGETVYEIPGSHDKVAARKLVTRYEAIDSKLRVLFRSHGYACGRR